MFNIDELPEDSVVKHETVNDVFMRREHLKRQYIKFYKMEKKIKNKRMREKVARYKRQVLKLLGRE